MGRNLSPLVPISIFVVICAFTENGSRETKSLSYVTVRYLRRCCGFNKSQN